MYQRIKHIVKLANFGESDKLHFATLASRIHKFQELLPELMEIFSQKIVEVVFLSNFCVFIDSN